MTRTILLMAFGFAIGWSLGECSNTRADEPERWMLIKVYAKAYSQETACLLDLEQAANMSPPGTKFKCERIPK